MAQYSRTEITVANRAEPTLGAGGASIVSETRGLSLCGLGSMYIASDVPNLEVRVRDKFGANIEGARVDVLGYEGDLEQTKYTNASGLTTFFVSATCKLRINAAGKQQQKHDIDIANIGTRLSFSLLDAVPIIKTNKGTGINLVPTDPQNANFKI